MYIVVDDNNRSYEKAGSNRNQLNIISKFQMYSPSDY